MIDRYGAKAARDEISAIKFSVANTMLHAVDTAIQVHGALGVTDDTILSHWYRHERAARIYDGADEVHKTTLGRRILRRYRLGLTREPGRTAGDAPMTALLVREPRRRRTGRVRRRNGPWRPPRAPGSTRPSLRG